MEGMRNHSDMDVHKDILSFYLSQRNGWRLSKSSREQKRLPNRRLCNVRIHLLNILRLGTEVGGEEMSIHQTITAHDTERDLLREYIQQYGLSKHT